MPAYDRGINPPAPVADVIVANPVTRNKRASLRGKAAKWMPALISR